MMVRALFFYLSIVCACMHARMHVCMYACTQVCMYVYMYMCRVCMNEGWSFHPHSPHMCMCNVCVYGSLEHCSFHPSIMYMHVGICVKLVACLGVCCFLRPPIVCTYASRYEMFEACLLEVCVN